MRLRVPLPLRLRRARPSTEAASGYSPGTSRRARSPALTSHGLTWLEVFQSPGHQLEGGTQKLVYVDADASLEQLSALRDAFHGRLGGPLAELAELTGEWLGIEQAEVECEVSEGAGRIAVAGRLRAVMSPRLGRDETPTTLRDAFFSTVPGSPAWISKASELTVVIPEHGLQFSFEGRSAIQSEFRYAT